MKIRGGLETSLTSPLPRSSAARLYVLQWPFLPGFLKGSGEVHPGQEMPRVRRGPAHLQMHTAGERDFQRPYFYSFFPEVECRLLLAPHPLLSVESIALSPLLPSRLPRPSPGQGDCCQSLQDLTSLLFMPLRGAAGVEENSLVVLRRVNPTLPLPGRRGGCINNVPWVSKGSWFLQPW